MTKERSTATKRRKLWAIAITTFVGIAVIAGGIFAASPAQAADIPTAIKTVTITSPNTNPSSPLTVGQTFQVNATWAVPDGSLPGDTFTLHFPSPVSGAAASFNLTNPSGADYGTCVTTGSSISCTLGDAYSPELTNVSGTLHFLATAVSTASGSVDFTTGATSIPAPLPGGGIVTPGASNTTKVSKAGALQANGTLSWEVVLPDSVVTDGAVITDTFQAGETLNLAPFKIAEGLGTDFTGGSFHGKGITLTRGIAAGQYSITNDPATNSFTVVFHTPDKTPGMVYVWVYSTTPDANTPTDSNFTNTVVGNGITAHASIEYVTAGGTGDGTTSTPTPSATPVPTDTPTATPTPTDTPTATPSPTDTPTSTPVPTSTPTLTPIPTDSPTTTPIPTEKPSDSPTRAPVTPSGATVYTGGLAFTGTNSNLLLHISEILLVLGIAVWYISVLIRREKRTKK